MGHVFVLGANTHVSDRSAATGRGLTHHVDQKPHSAKIGVVFQGWDRQGLGDRRAEAGVYSGWAYSKCERSAMGRRRTQWQGRTVHRIVRSHGPHLGCERGALCLSILRCETALSLAR
jgi:hypothetical protein